MNLSTIDIMNLGTSILLCSALWRQVQIIIVTDWKNPSWNEDRYKLLFPIFNFLLIVSMWLPYLDAFGWSAFCMLIGGFIAFYTYWSPIFKKKK